MNTMSGLIELVRKILKGTFIIEGIGAALFATQFIPEFGVRYGIWASVFNSVSAFCNAGIDIIQTDRAGRAWFYCVERPAQGLPRINSQGVSVKKSFWEIEAAL